MNKQTIVYELIFLCTFLGAFRFLLFYSLFYGIRSYTGFFPSDLLKFSLLFDIIL